MQKSILHIIAFGASLFFCLPLKAAELAPPSGNLSQSNEEMPSNQINIDIDAYDFGGYEKRKVTYPNTQIIYTETSQLAFDVEPGASNIGLALNINNSPNQHTCFISIKGDSGIQKKAIRSSAYVSGGSLFENVNYQKYIPYEGSLGGSYTASINKEDGSVTLKKGADFSHTFPCERLMNRNEIYYNLVSQNPETNPVKYRNVRTELSTEKKALSINTKSSPLYRTESANPTPKETASLLSSTSVDKVSPQETTITLPPTSSPQSRKEISSNQEGLIIHGFGFGSYQNRTVTYPETQTIDLSKNQILTFTVEKGSTNVGVALSDTTNPNRHSCFIKVRDAKDNQKKAFTMTGNPHNKNEHIRAQRFIPYTGSLAGTYKVKISSINGMVTLEKGKYFNQKVHCPLLRNKTKVYYNLVSQNPEAQAVEYRKVKVVTRNPA